MTCWLPTNAKVQHHFGFKDWHRIRDLLESNDESTARRKEEAGEEKQRNLKELSDSLKRSWGQTDKVGYTQYEGWPNFRKYWG